MGHGRCGVDYHTQRLRTRASKEKFLAELRKRNKSKATNETVFSQPRNENQTINIDEYLAPKYRRRNYEEPSTAPEQQKPDVKEESTSFWGKVKGFFGSSDKQPEEKPTYTRVRPLTPEELERYKAEHPEYYSEKVEQTTAEAAQTTADVTQTNVEAADTVSSENNVSKEADTTKPKYNEGYAKEDLKSIMERVQAKIQDGDREGAYEDLRFAMVDNFDKPELTTVYSWALNVELENKEEEQLLEGIQTKFKNGDEVSTYKDINKLYWSLRNELNNKKAKQFMEEVQTKIQEGNKKEAYKKLCVAMIECPNNKDITTLYWLLQNELNPQE